LEARVPLSDSAALLDYVPGLPSSFKIHGGWSKYLLRSAMQGILPDEIRLRRTKLGFTVPETEWGRDVAASDLAVAMLDATPDYVSRDQMACLVREASEGRGSALFWRLFSVVRWQEIVVRPTSISR